MSDGSILTDELKKLIGVPVDPTMYKVEEGAIFRYAEAIGHPNPCHFSGGPVPIARPASPP